jgi:nucleotide-binding universal stress UspA family protein
MIPKIRRALLVTDFSATANKALPYAYALVEPGGEVHLLHVIEHVETPNPLYAHYSAGDLFDPESQRQAVASVEKHLKELIPKDAAERNITTVVAGAIHPVVADGIVTEAIRRQADVIVIGSHGRTGLAHVLIGSVAEAVIRRATVPVIVVPRKRPA